MKKTFLPVLLVSCALLFSGCVSQGQTEVPKENAIEQKTTLAQGAKPTTEFFSPTTTHEHDPNKKCDYPDDAFSACTEKAAGAACEYSASGKSISGKCTTEPCGKVVCKNAE